MYCGTTSNRQNPSRVCPTSRCLKLNQKGDMPNYLPFLENYRPVCPKRETNDGRVRMGNQLTLAFPLFLCIPISSVKRYRVATHISPREANTYSFRGKSTPYSSLRFRGKDQLAQPRTRNGFNLTILSLESCRQMSPLLWISLIYPFASYVGKIFSQRTRYLVSWFNTCASLLWLMCLENSRMLDGLKPEATSPVVLGFLERPCTYKHIRIGKCPNEQLFSHETQTMRFGLVPLC